MTERKNEIVTFGCRLNTYESEVIRAHLDAAGRENVIVFNTCTVTKEAERQARQAIRKAHKENPNAEIIVTGCAAQVKPEDFAAIPGVSQVLGNDEKMRPQSWQRGANAKIIVNDIMSVEETAGHLVKGFDGRSRAFVQVQNGCDHRCTFCIIPYGRGNSRSVPIGEIVRQVKALVEEGYKEVVLTGVDITSYGPDLPGQPTLGQMVRRLLALVPELPRLRMSSLDPVEIDEDMWWCVENEPRLMPHLHLSLQAGDDMILKRMKRRHLRHHILEVCEKARRLRPDMVFGADIIAGFPTETDAMFENTLKIVEEADLLHLHVFPYSPREGTPAAKMPQVDKEVRKERAARLRAAGDSQMSKYMSARIGETSEILIETGGKGHCPHYLPVAVQQDVSDNILAHVRFETVQDGRMVGVVV